MEADGYTNQNYWSEDGWKWRNNGVTVPRTSCDLYSKSPSQPRVCISWYEAEAYAAWWGGRLPTEAEWEYAARGPASLEFPWGNDFDGKRLNFCDSNCEYDNRDQSVSDGFKYTAPVGSYMNDISWIGAHDLSGNVSEWVADWYSETYYTSSPQEDPQGPLNGERRGRRGGSWGDYQGYAHLASRAWSYPNYDGASVGFRVVVRVQIPK